MRSLLAAALLLAGGTALAQPPAAPPARVDAREQVPAAFIAAWKLSPRESTFPGGRTPTAGYRFFSYTADGMLLVDYWTAGATGTISAGNWTAAFDGTWKAEYTKGFGSTAYATVLLAKRDEQTLDLKAAKAGKVFETGTFTVTPDGKTMTFAYEAGGAKTVAVYHPWNLID